MRGMLVALAAIVATSRAAAAQPKPAAVPATPPPPTPAAVPATPPPPTPTPTPRAPAEPIGAGDGGSDTGSDTPDAGSDEPPPDESPAPPDDSDRPLHEDNEFGPLIVIEDVEITGNSATNADVIRRALPVAPGDVLHSSDHRLRDIRYKVLALGFFRDVEISMRKGGERGNVIVVVHVIERGTVVLNRLWLGTSSSSKDYFGTDLTERNLLGTGIAVGGGFIYAQHGDIAGSRDQYAGEIRAADASLFDTRWGATGSLTLVHGSEPYQVSGSPTSDAASDYGAYDYRRIGGRVGATYDVTALSRLTAGVRLEQIDANLPPAPTQLLPDGELVGLDLHLHPGGSRVSTLGFGFDRDTRPDPVLPHSGDRITLLVELGSGVIGSSYDYSTAFARYEHWWPLDDEKQTLGLRVVGGIATGDTPEFDRIHISDVDHMLTPRALGLVLSTAQPYNLLGTRDGKPTFGDLGGTVTGEYALRLFRHSGKHRIYGGDLFLAAGVWALAETEDLHVRDAAVWKSLPVDLFADAGVRLDTDIGIFELTISNLLGRVR